MYSGVNAPIIHHTIYIRSTIFSIIVTGLILLDTRSFSRETPYCNEVISHPKNKNIKTSCIMIRGDKPPCFSRTDLDRIFRSDR